MNSAIISPCGLYRYTLHRQFHDMPVKPCLFVMLNPSTADATKDDATIRRCVGFAKREGCNRLTVVNLFAFRATDPDGLLRCSDPVGPENDTHLVDQVNKHSDLGIVIVAWGSNALAARTRGLVKVALIKAGALCLGTTKDGHPCHPLRLRTDTPLIPWVQL